MNEYARSEIERVLADVRELSYWVRGLNCSALKALPTRIEMLEKMTDEIERELVEMLAEDRGE
jgi:uncharacterized protein Yka (UPF0111/DUF47 family)